jgi:hypothetical protein
MEMKMLKFSGFKNGDENFRDGYNETFLGSK